MFCLLSPELSALVLFLLIKLFFYLDLKKYISIDDTIYCKVCMSVLPKIKKFYFLKKYWKICLVLEFVQLYVKTYLQDSLGDEVMG